MLSRWKPAPEITSANRGYDGSRQTKQSVGEPQEKQTKGSREGIIRRVSREEAATWGPARENVKGKKKAHFSVRGC